MVVNFRIRKINRDTRKLFQTFMIIIIKKLANYTTTMPNMPVQKEKKTHA